MVTSFVNDIGADKMWVPFGIGNKLLCHMMDKPETPSSNDIAVTESFIVSLYFVYCAGSIMAMRGIYEPHWTKLPKAALVYVYIHVH